MPEPLDPPPPTPTPATTTHDWSALVDRAHLEEVRDRAAGLCPGGVLHLVLEVIAYADDEAAARGPGATGRCRVTLHADGSFTVADDGRGTATVQRPDGTAVRKPVMATRDVRFFGAPDPPTLPDGHPRRGMSVVAALSSRLTHLNRRLEGSWSQSCVHGIPTGDLEPVQADGTTGTTVHVLPDAAALPDPARLSNLDLSALAALRSWPAVEVEVVDAR